MVKYTPVSDADAKVVADPVDWARHYWEQYELGDGLEAFAAMTSMMRFYRMMTEQVETALKACDLNVTDYLLLMTLELSETGSRLISRLARNLLVHPTTATLATDRLEARGLLQRRPHPTDRRAILVSISPSGRQLTQQATNALRDVGFGFPEASERELQQVSKLISQLRRAAGDADVPKD